MKQKVILAQIPDPDGEHHSWQFQDEEGNPLGIGLFVSEARALAFPQARKWALSGIRRWSSREAKT